jgi:hypothetical protein
MSERGVNAHWVRNINHNRRISFTINNSNYEGEGRIIDSTKESQLAAQVSEIMNVKYHWDQGLIVELRPIRSSVRQEIHQDLLFYEKLNNYDT